MMVFENFLRGREKSVWISSSSDLKYDAERDLNDIGADIKVHDMKKVSTVKPFTSE